MFKRILNWLEILTREIPPPKSQQQASISLIQPILTPAEQAIIAQAEQTLQQIETPVVKLSEVPEVPEVSTAPRLVELLEVPEIPEVPTAHTAIEISEVPAPEPSPTGWASIEAGEEQIQPMEISEIPELPAPEPTKATRKKASSRSKQVEEHLEKAWNEGFRTYDQLMNYVELATGKGCSKRVIAAWKKSRGTVAA